MNLTSPVSVEKMLSDTVPFTPGLLTFRGTLEGKGVEIGFAFPPASNEAVNVGAVAFAYLDAEGRQRGDALFVGYVYRDFETSEFFFRRTDLSGTREGGRSKSATKIAMMIFESATGRFLDE